MISFIKKIRLSWIIAFLFLLLVGYGIYNNPDRGAAPIDPELQQIIDDMESNASSAKDLMREAESCFYDESLEEGKSDWCVSKISSFLNTFKDGDEPYLQRLEEYKKHNASELDSQTMKYIDDNLTLYRSNAYTDVNKSLKEYLEVTLEWHEYWRDVVTVKGPDNMSEQELFELKRIAEDLTNAEEVVNRKAEAFNSYLDNEYGSEFTEQLYSHVESL